MKEEEDEKLNNNNATIINSGEREREKENNSLAGYANNTTVLKGRFLDLELVEEEENKESGE